MFESSHQTLGLSLGTSPAQLPDFIRRRAPFRFDDPNPLDVLMSELAEIALSDSVQYVASLEANVVVVDSLWNVGALWFSLSGGHTHSPSYIGDTG